MADQTVKIEGIHPVTGGELLATLFIYLKLTDQIDWSWWWVLAPVWVAPLVAVVLVAVVTWLFKKS